MGKKSGKGKDVFSLESLGESKQVAGQIFPVIKDQNGNILDGFHRKRVDPDWKETVVNVENPTQALLIRVHSNILRRDVGDEEKGNWIIEARRILKEQGSKGTQPEIAELLGLGERGLSWVKKYDPDQHNISHGNKSYAVTFFGYNVWGFKDNGWRKLILSNDPNQPDKEFYHGSTPAFVIHQLLMMFKPKSVLDSMAGVGTTGYVCKQHGIECDQFDVYPYEKYGVLKGEAESLETTKRYDLIFNHIPYYGMVKYGEDENDLSTMDEVKFFDKLERIFKKNYELLNENGIYAILVGDWRHGGRLIPITANVTIIGEQSRFVLQDEAIKLTVSQKSSGIQEYRASKSGYMAQTFDTVLIFKKGENKK